MKNAALIVGVVLGSCTFSGVAQGADRPRKMAQGKPQIQAYFDRPAQRTVEMAVRAEATLLGSPKIMQPRDLWGGALFVAWNILDLRKGHPFHCDTWRVCFAPYLGWRFAAGKAELKTSDGDPSGTEVATSYHAVSSGMGVVLPALTHLGFRFALGVTVPFVRASIAGNDDADTIDFLQTPFCGEAEADVRIPLSPFAKKRDWGLAFVYGYRLCTDASVTSKSDVVVDSEFSAMNWRGSILGGQVWLRF